MGTFYTKCLIENHIIDLLSTKKNVKSPDSVGNAGWRFDIGMEKVNNRKKSIVVPKLLVDTGSEYTWIPKNALEEIAVTREKKDLVFVMANGQQVTRSVGFAIICLDKYFTIDEVVFGEKGDLILLGARTLEGLFYFAIEK